MSGHLCLKWNNHSSAFLKSISSIQVKERFCDATIACQGKYFPVHRVVLSTCSDYFDEMFERMECQHPYIVFKDIEPREMELLLNYMYQGEVNVVQEMLPTLIKAAEALKVKGLAVPDDLPPTKDLSAGRKRSNTSIDTPQPKRRLDETKRRRRDSSGLSTASVEDTKEVENYTNSDTEINNSENTSSLLPPNSQLDDNETRLIKDEPLDSCEFGSGGGGGGVGGVSEGGAPSQASESNQLNKAENVCVNFPITDDSATYIKTEEASSEHSYEDQSSSWSDFGGGNILPNVSTSSMAGPDDIEQMETGSDSVANFEAEPFTRVASSSQMIEVSQGIGPIVKMQDSLSTVAISSLARGGKPKSKGQSMYYCAYCEYSSNNSKNLKTHTYLHTGERPFPCTLCLSRYIKKVDLENHMRIHTGERPFKCPTCFQTFRVKDHLKKHLNKKFKCVKAT